MTVRTTVLGFCALLACIAPASAATKRTQNFVVEAATPELAAEFGTLAEQYRREKAMQWLGREMPNWSQACPLKVTVAMSGAKGATTFTFPEGQVYQSMFIEGPLERLKNSVLPHEITHTVFAHHFRRPVPRWADEGGSVYSEDELERTRHDQMCRQVLNAGRGMPLKRLFSLKEYPNDVMVLYAQGFSISKYLVEQNDRATFLTFVGQGMSNGWDEAARSVYGYRNVDDLEQSWLDSLRKSKGQSTAVAAAAAAASPKMGKTAPAEAKLVVRQSSPPTMPMLDAMPVGRSQAPSLEPFPAARLGEPSYGPQEASPLYPNSGYQPTPLRSMASSDRPAVILFPPEPLRP